MQKVQCQFCGKDIWRKEHDLRRYKLIYCDRACRTKHQRALQPRVTCSACGKMIVLNGCRKRNSKTGLYFCNNECKNPYVARFHRWRANPHSHRSRRPAVISAAEGKCQNCGYHENECMLDVHHVDSNHRNNDWKNLRCLCVWCHIGHHRGAVELRELVLLTAPQ